jgi:hypothetical protein
MQVLSAADAKHWCETEGVALDVHGLPECPHAVGFDIPEDAGRRVYLAGTCMSGFSDEPGLLVWFHDWSVWPSGERMHIFDRFRLSYGDTEWLIDRPARIFEQSEFEDAVSYVTLAVLFLWDCYVVTPGRTKFLFFSHDEYGAFFGLNVDL